MSSPVIEMQQVTVAALHAPRAAQILDVTWRAGVGDAWAIGGLPGSGKTDLLLTTAGLLPPFQGEVRLRVGFVFANEGRLFSHLTVAENLALPVCYHRNCSENEARTRVAEVLEQTDLCAVADQRPNEINRNWRTRVALARALVLGPELLLLDDPLRGIDQRQARWWLGFLGQLRRTQPSLTLVVTADDLRPWVGPCNRFAMIDNRRWVVLGDETDLRKHDEPLLRELLAND